MQFFFGGEGGFPMSLFMCYIAVVRELQFPSWSFPFSSMRPNTSHFLFSKNNFLLPLLEFMQVPLTVFNSVVFFHHHIKHNMPIIAPAVAATEAREQADKDSGRPDTWRFISQNGWDRMSSVRTVLFLLSASGCMLCVGVHVGLWAL